MCSNSSSKLFDDDIGPIETITQAIGPVDTFISHLGQFFAYNQIADLILALVLSIVVYFFNFPAKAIGLPLIKVSKPVNQFGPSTLDNVE